MNAGVAANAKLKPDEIPMKRVCRGSGNVRVTMTFSFTRTRSLSAKSENRHDMGGAIKLKKTISRKGVNKTMQVYRTETGRTLHFNFH